MSIPRKGQKGLASDVIVALSRSMKEKAKELDKLVASRSIESVRAHPRVSQRQPELWPEEEEGTIK